MRVGQLQQAAESTAGEGRTLKINGTAHAFKMLSDGLYSDKISSILRELGSNAVDSHTAAGKADVPFEVKLPTQIDPEFYVRDFGVGLTEAEVYDLYLTYFSSSKQASNDFIGGFGIGSKSPFAYTDSFNVTVAKDGTRIAFAVYLDHDAPKVVKLLEEPATPEWPSGLQVGFAVRPEDFRAFSEKASEVYAWFKVPPQVLGDCSFERASPALTFPHATVLKQAAGQNGHCSVRVGGCRYFIDKRAIPSGDNLTATAILNNQAIVLEAEIGKVALTGSRESISYDAKGETQQYLVSLAAAAYEDLVAYALSPLDDAALSPAEQLRQTCRRVAQVSLEWRTLFTTPKLRERMASDTFVGRVLAAAKAQGSYYPGFRLLYGLADEQARAKAAATAGKMSILETGKRKDSTVVFREDTDLTRITANEHLVFLEDLSSSTYARLRAFLLALDKPPRLTCVICARENWPELVSALGQPDYRTLEDIPQIAKTEAAKKDRAGRQQKQEEDAADRFARAFGSPVMLYSPASIGDSSLYDLLVNNDGVPPFVVSNEATDRDGFAPIKRQLARMKCSAPVLLMTPTRIKKLTALGVAFRTFEDVGNWLLQQGFFEPLMWHWFPDEHDDALNVKHALSDATSFGRLASYGLAGGNKDALASLRQIAQLSPGLGRLIQLLTNHPAVIPTNRYAESVTTRLPSSCNRLDQLPPEFLAALTEIRELVLEQPILQGFFGHSGAPVLIKCLEFAQGKKGE